MNKLKGEEEIELTIPKKVAEVRGVTEFRQHILARKNRTQLRIDGIYDGALEAFRKGNQEFCYYLGNGAELLKPLIAKFKSEGFNTQTFSSTGTKLVRVTF